MLEYKVNFFSTDPDRVPEQRRLEDRLAELGSCRSYGHTPGLAQFGLFTQLSLEEVRLEVNRLGLKGSTRVNKMEKEDDYDTAAA